MTWFLAIIYGYSLLFLSVTIVGDLRNSISRSTKDSIANEVLEIRSYNNGDTSLFIELGSSRNVLVSTPLIDNNYLSWNCSMKIVLGAKVKLRFINGKFKMSNEDSLDFEQWNGVDCMETS